MDVIRLHAPKFPTTCVSVCICVSACYTFLSRRLDLSYSNTVLILTLSSTTFNKHQPCRYCTKCKICLKSSRRWKGQLDIWNPTPLTETTRSWCDSKMQLNVLDLLLLYTNNTIPVIRFMRVRRCNIDRNLRLNCAMSGFEVWPWESMSTWPHLKHQTWQI